MSWNSVIGQERVKRMLRTAIERKQIAHSYLFFGQAGIGKEALALEFAKTLNCESGGIEACGVCRSCKQFDTLQHPDIYLIFPLPTGSNEKAGDNPYEKLSEDQLGIIREELQKKVQDPYYVIEIPKANFIKINSIREVKRQASLAHGTSRYKIFIILNAESMNAESSNSFLKTLEEPLPDTIFLLTTYDKDLLLPTIVSRCQQIQCDLLSEEEIQEALINRDNIEEGHAKLLARLANGSYGVARRLSSEDMAAQQDEVINFLGYSVTKQYSKILEFIEELVRRDRLALYYWLEIMQVWLREAMISQATGKETTQLFQPERLRKFLQRYSHAHLEKALEAIDTTIAQIDKNVYLPLALFSLSMELYNSVVE
ncbi:MAG: DNA polymerase III subunit delta' [Bacteroidetes bacterium]|nr:DNA polymerase III subunit delta' [Bacteroidota bacterium]